MQHEIVRYNLDAIAAYEFRRREKEPMMPVATTEQEHKNRRRAN